MASDRNNRESVEDDLLHRAGKGVPAALAKSDHADRPMAPHRPRRETPRSAHRPRPPHVAVCVDGRASATTTARQATRQSHRPLQSTAAIAPAGPPVGPGGGDVGVGAVAEAGRGTDLLAREQEAGSPGVEQHRPRRPDDRTVGRSSRGPRSHARSPVSGSRPITVRRCRVVHRRSPRRRAGARSPLVVLRPRQDAAVSQVEGVEARSVASSRSAAQCRAASSRRRSPGR